MDLEMEFTEKISSKKKMSEYSIQHKVEETDTAENVAKELMLELLDRTVIAVGRKSALNNSDKSEFMLMETVYVQKITGIMSDQQVFAKILEYHLMVEAIAESLLYNEEFFNAQTSVIFGSATETGKYVVKGQIDQFMDIKLGPAHLNLFYSEQEQILDIDENPIFPNSSVPYRALPDKEINILMKDTPFAMLLELGYFYEETEMVLKDKRLVEKLEAIINETLVTVNILTATQATLLYILALKMNRKVLRFFCPLVESIVVGKVESALGLFFLMQILESIDSGARNIMQVLQTTNLFFHEELITKTIVRRVFSNSLRQAQTNRSESGVVISRNAEELIRIVSCKFRTDNLNELYLLSKYIGTGVISSSEQLNLAFLFLICNKMPIEEFLSEYEENFLRNITRLYRTITSTYEVSSSNISENASENNLVV